MQLVSIWLIPTSTACTTCSSNLPSPMLSKIWRWLLETINCWGSCAINSSVTWNPAALPIMHKMDSLTSYKATTLGDNLVKLCLVTLSYLQCLLRVIYLLQTVDCIGNRNRLSHVSRISKHTNQVVGDGNEAKNSYWNIAWSPMISRDLTWPHNLTWSHMTSHDLTWSHMISHSIHGAHPPLAQILHCRKRS